MRLTILIVGSFTSILALWTPSQSLLGQTFGACWL